MGLNDFVKREALLPTSGRRLSSPPHPVGILFVIDQLCTPGGAELALLNIIRSLPKRFSPRLITFKRDHTQAAFRNLPCPCYVLPLRRTYGVNAVRVARLIRRLIRSKNIQIVHTFHETSDLWAAVVAKISGCRILISSRRDMGFLRSSKHELAYRFLNRHFDKIISVSEEVRKKCVQAENVDPRSVVTIHNGVDLKLVDRCAASDIRDELRFGKDDPVIITTGNIRPVKGIDVLIRAARLVCSQWPNARFLVLGKTECDQTYTEELYKAIDCFGVGKNVLLVGSKEQVIGALKGSTVFCLPSRSEGFSNALLEAMACSLPCVATNVGGNPEAVTDSLDGFIVPSDDPEALAQSICSLLSSPELRVSLGKRARHTVETRFSHATMMNRLMDIYDDLLLKTTATRS